MIVSKLTGFMKSKATYKSVDFINLLDVNQTERSLIQLQD